MMLTPLTVVLWEVVLRWQRDLHKSFAFVCILKLTACHKDLLAMWSFCHKTHNNYTLHILTVGSIANESLWYAIDSKIQMNAWQCYSATPISLKLKTTICNGWPSLNYILCGILRHVALWSLLIIGTAIPLAIVSHMLVVKRSLCNFCIQVIY